jgi:predicted dehydrogenase
VFPPLRTVLIGMGRVGAGFAEDARINRFYPYATHAQVLREHPAFSWSAVVDPDPQVLRLARERWRVPCVVSSIPELLRCCQPEVAVIATPPHLRWSLIEPLPHLRGILVEKPLANSVAEASQLLEGCAQRGIRVQVNLWRRADETFRALAAGRLTELIGRPQAIFSVYGNGLRNNGTHLIDLVRMLLGEVKGVQCVAGSAAYAAGPIAVDIQVPFNLLLRSGAVATFQPVRFEYYRENSLDVWGEAGRLAILREGLQILLYRCQAHAALEGEREIDSETPSVLQSTVGHAFYHMYSNLADAIHEQADLWSPGESALRTGRVVEAVCESQQKDGSLVVCP